MKYRSSTRRATLLATCCHALALQGCGGDPEALVVEFENEAALGPSWEEYKLAAKTLDGADFYVVEWDIVLPDEAALRDHYDELVLREESKLAVYQRISTGFEPVFPFADALDISYCVSNTFTNKSTVVADMTTAASAWEQTVNVRFRYVSAQDSSCDQDNSNVDFAVMPTTLLTGCGSSKLVWGNLGCPIGALWVTGVLLINYGIFPLSDEASGLTPVGVLKHELGHMLGFMHEHPWAPSFGGCSQEPTAETHDRTGRQLTAYDQNSVMHYRECAGIAGSDYDISTLDGEGARKVYSMPAAWYVPLL